MSANKASDKCACLKHRYSKIKIRISTYLYVIINLFVYFCVKNIMNLTILFTTLYQKRGQCLYISSAHKIKKVANKKRTVQKSPKTTEYIIH